MRRLPLLPPLSAFFRAAAPALWLALALAGPAALGGCEAAPTTSTAKAGGADASTDVGGGTDAAGVDSTGADAAATDAAGADTTAGDAAELDGTAGTDAVAGDGVAPGDVSLTDGSDKDGKDQDGTGGDGTGADTTGKDTTAADIQPTKCTSAADCPKGFGDCQSSGCDTATGKCFVKIVPDGANCKMGGLCGGAGTCQMGACKVASNPCAPKACAPKLLKCGDTITLDPSTFGASTMNAWTCTAAKLDGGEQVFALAGDATNVADVALSGAVTEAATLALIANSIAGTCNSTTCAKAGQQLKLGLKGGQVYTIVVDTKAGLTGSLTLTVQCNTPVGCGDGTCSAGETCNGCPKDCGACKECGDGTCAPKTENCASCVKDCGVCKGSTDPGCTVKGTPGCPGCSCEAEVCKADGYCCKTAWDKLCVDQCADILGVVCSNPDACGDYNCGSTEDSKNCPQDCGDVAVCGDGKCSATETCGACPLDCGICPPTSQPVCGNSKCDSNEHCASCPKDCGVCSTECSAMTTKSTPGCPGCACETQVCKEDKYCCETAWDGYCVSACAKISQLVCPKDMCGDGICSGSETCSSCTKDCGPCVCGDGTCQSTENDTTCVADCVKCGDGKCSPSENSTACPADCPVCGDGVCSAKESATSCAQDCIKCGDGKCSKPSETLQSCPADCSIGCKNKCGNSSEDDKGKTCWCDDVCDQAGDCCADKKQFCP